MIVVGAFFRETREPGPEAAMLREYEDAVKKRRDSKKNPFVLEDSALTWSTVVLSSALIAFGILTLTHGGHGATPAGVTFILAASAGAIGTIWAWLVYKGRASALRQPPPAN
jgi:drug/metabolite transporter (DMT)-like permease